MLEENKTLVQTYADMAFALSKIDMIPRERFTELLVAERDLMRLKELIHKKMKEYGNLTHSELEMIDTLFSCGNELTDDENTD